MALVLPGDVVHSSSTSLLELSEDAHLRLGPGLLPERTPDGGQATLVATRAGILGHLPARAADASSASERTAKKPKTEASSSSSKQHHQELLWVEANTSRYVPALADTVVGQITARGPDFYTVSLHSAHAAALPVLAFEGATKRHRPNLRVGTLVYARVVSAERHPDPELSCVNPVTGKADGLGELKVGEREAGCAMVFTISLGLAASLRGTVAGASSSSTGTAAMGQHPLLPRVAAHFPFESAIGQNGLLWARATRPSHLLALGRVLERAEHVGLTWASQSSSSTTPTSRRRKQQRFGQTALKKEEDEDMQLDDQDEDHLAQGDDGDDPAPPVTQALDVAKFRGALSKEEIKQLVSPFL